MEKDNVIKFKRSQAELSRYIEFSMGSEDYAIPLSMVREVISLPDTTPIPRTPAHILGTTDLRGQSVSVIDIRKKLKIDARLGCEEAVIIIDIGGINIGVVVDSINKVFAFTLDEISELPESKTYLPAQYIVGAFQKTSSLIIILDIAKVLDLSDHHEIDAWKKSA
ncbi:MAG: chemotaxis protein CheW [Bacteriovorax sp.]|jgi:purine-binding chemotaxis protein CheW